MIPHLFVITPNELGRRIGLAEQIVSLSKQPQIGLIIREPDATASTLQSLMKKLEKTACVPIMHLKTPGALTWVKHNPSWGLHLGATVDACAIRPHVHGLLGQSTHSLDEVKQAFDNQVDYVTLSPVYPPRSKPNDNRPLISLEILREATQYGPVIALGGLNADRYRQLRSASIWGGAVLGDVFTDHTPISTYF